MSSSKRGGIIATIVFHILLFLFFMFTGMTQPDPLPEPEGAMIQLGFTDEGSGDEVPDAVSENIPEPSPEEADPQVEDVVDETAETQEESPVAVSKPKITPKPKVTPKVEPKPKPEKPKVTSDMFSNPSSSNGNGNDNTSGSKGKPNGDKNGHGVFGGNGVSYNLSGRKLVGAIRTEKPDEEGIIVLRIKVDRNGRVMSATNTSASNTTSLKLLRLAKKAAMAAKFNVSSSSGIEQTGTLKFHFKLR